MIANDPLVLRSSRVLQADGTFVPASIHIEGAIITRVGDHTVPVVGESTKVIDFGAKPITPAFVNAHTHVSLGFLRGVDLSRPSAGNLVEDFFFRIEKDLEPEAVRAFARMGAYECLLSGIGLVWDHYYFADVIVEALSDVGLAGVVAPTLQDLAGPGVDQLEAQLEATERIANDEALKGRGIFAALGPHATDTVSAELWQRLATVAERLHIPVHSHAAQSAEECLRVLERTGMSPLSWLRDLGVFERSPHTVLVHCLYARDQDLAAVDRETTTLGFCPYAQRIFGFPADPRRWSEAGIDWFVATDTSAGNDSMNLQKELRAVAELRTSPTSYSPELARLHAEPTGAGLAAGLERTLAARDATFLRAAELAEPERLLSRVWGIPGALHPGVRAGVLEAGALASVLVWNTDHPAFWPAETDRAVLQALAMGDTLGALDTAVVCGKIMGEVGDFAGAILRSETYRWARDEANARYAEVAGRL